MGKIIEVQLAADRSVRSGEEVSLASLFTAQLGTNAAVLEDIKAGSKIVCRVVGLDVLKCQAGITKNKGENTSISTFLKMNDLYKQIISPKGLSKGDALPVVIESA